jgi:hypothetical protein
MISEGPNDMPGDLGDAIDRVRKENTTILYRTTIHSKEASRAEADKTTQDFREFLEKTHGMDPKANDITAALFIGTFHWYDAKPVFPDLKPADLPRQRDLKVLEVRKYDPSAQRDGRAIFVMSIDKAEIEKTILGIASFYTGKGYELHQSFGGLKDMERAGPDTKF